MRARAALALTLLVCLPVLAIAQEDGEEIALSPLEQCLEVGQMRYQRCTSELDSDATDCTAEYENYEAQCYELNQ